MVSSQQEEVLGVLDLVAQEQKDGLETLFATIDIVSEEEIVRLGRKTTVLEEAEEVVVLPMDIA